MFSQESSHIEMNISNVQRCQRGVDSKGSDTFCCIHDIICQWNDLNADHKPGNWSLVFFNCCYYKLMSDVHPKIEQRVFLSFHAPLFWLKGKEAGFAEATALQLLAEIHLASG